jgi:uncharacterized membrane protein
VSVLTVWRFDGPQAAADALPRLEALVAVDGARVSDAALISWPVGRRKPSAHTLGSLTGPGELWGGFWGIVLGLVFLTPLAGPSFGAAAGAVAGSLTDFGVADDMVKVVRDAVTPGTSALFVLSSRTSADRLATELGGLDVQRFASVLSVEQEQRLRDSLGEESSHPERG